jgi:O-antigen ligase
MRAGISGTERLSLGLFLIVVGAAPLVFGSVEPFVLAIGGGLVAVSALLAPLGDCDVNARRVLWAASFVAIAYLALFTLQLWPNPPGGLANPVWRDTAELTDTQMDPTISVAPGQTFYLTGVFAVLAGVFMLAVVHGRNAATAAVIVQVLAFSGAAYAVLGIAMFEFAPDHILWQKKLAYLEHLTTPFINRNTAATYYGTVAVLLTAMLFNQTEILRGDGHRGSAFAGVLPSVSLVCLSIVGIALFMTASRAGIASSVTGILVFGTLWSLAHTSNWSIRIGAVLGMLLALIVLILLFGETVIDRLDQGNSGERRLCTYESIIAAVALHPLFGHGLGSFELAFPPFRDPACGVFGTWDRAHNSFLQIAFELGLPAAFTALFFWILAGMALLNGYLSRGRGRIFPMIGLAVWTVAGLHSLVDFSLEIPGYAATFLAIVGATLSQAVLRRKVEVKPHERSVMHHQVRT